MPEFENPAYEHRASGQSKATSRRSLALAPATHIRTVNGLFGARTTQSRSPRNLTGTDLPLDQLIGAGASVAVETARNHECSVRCPACCWPRRDDALRICGERSFRQAIVNERASYRRAGGPTRPVTALSLGSRPQGKLQGLGAAARDTERQAPVFEHRPRLKRTASSRPETPRLFSQSQSRSTSCTCGRSRTDRERCVPPWLIG